MRIDGDAGNGDLLLRIQSGSATLLSYIQESRELVVGSDGNLIGGESLKHVQGTLLIPLSYLDRNHNGGEEEKLQQDELPFSVTMLIYDLRRSTIF